MAFAQGGITAVAALAVPELQRTSVSGALCGILALGMAGLYARPCERFAGLRYLNRGMGTRRGRSLLATTIASLVVGLGGAALFLAKRGRARAQETVAVLAVLTGTLAFAVC